MKELMKERMMVLSKLVASLDLYGFVLGFVFKDFIPLFRERERASTHALRLGGAEGETESRAGSRPSEEPSAGPSTTTQRSQPELKPKV